MDRIIYSLTADWHYALIIVLNSFDNPIFAGIAFGFILITLARLYILLSTSSNARELFTYGYRYLNGPKQGSVCFEPIVMENVKKFAVTAQKRLALLIYSILFLALLISLFIRPLSL